MLTEPRQNEELIAKLDTIIAVLQLAFKPQIDAARAQVLADPVSAAILETAGSGWIDAGELKGSVAKETRQSERTVARRIATLVLQRALDQSGSGSRVRYRSSGLI